jgi:hypothetical protein
MCLTFLLVTHLLVTIIARVAADSIAQVLFVAWLIDSMLWFLYGGVAIYGIFSASINLRQHWYLMPDLAQAAHRRARDTQYVGRTFRPNTISIWAHLGGAIVMSSLVYALLRAAGYAEEISFRLGAIALLFSIAVPALSARQSDQVWVRLSTVSGRFLVILCVVYASIIAAGPIARSLLSQMAHTMVLAAVRPSVLVGLILVTLSILVPRLLPQVRLLWAQRVYRGSLVLIENNGTTEARAVDRCMTIYRTGRIIMVKVRFVRSLMKPACLAVVVRIDSGAAIDEQVMELFPNAEIRIDLWSTLRWEC